METYWLLPVRRSKNNTDGDGSIERVRKHATTDSVGFGGPHPQGAAAWYDDSGFGRTPR